MIVWVKIIIWLKKRYKNHNIKLKISLKKRKKSKDNIYGKIDYLMKIGNKALKINLKQDVGIVVRK